MNFFKEFALSDAEWKALEKQYEGLLGMQGWTLLRGNVKNNHTDDIEDVMQEQYMAMHRAAVYHKRQTYITSCFAAVQKYTKDPMVLKVVEELQNLWENKTKHGAGKVKYGEFQQDVLEAIVNAQVPQEERPDKNKPLEIDAAFAPYFKMITWNSKKQLGKKITREKSWRSGLVSLSEHLHLGVA